MKRLHHLDSLRGVAALLVALHHSMLPFPDLRRKGLLTLLTGESAVLFFFLLSGFVLSGSLQKITDSVIPRVAAYWIRRGFRLYPTVLASVLFTIVVSAFYWAVPPGADSSGVSPGILKQLREASLFREHGSWLNELTLRATTLNPPLWTIRVELICSFLMPFLFLFSRKLPGLVLPIAVGLGLLFTRTSWDFRYLFQFYLGYIVWRDRAFAVRIPAAISGWLMLGLFLLLLACNGLGAGIIVQTVLLAALFFLLVPCTPGALRGLLERRAPAFLGRVSFSFYALHWPVLMFFLSKMLSGTPGFLVSHQLSSAMILFLLSACVTAALAGLSERWVEAGSNAFGRFLSERLIQWLAPAFPGNRTNTPQDVHG
jgi:peptidoglycan/LPS O-acetylase OafA/YrhL